MNDKVDEQSICYWISTNVKFLSLWPSILFCMLNNQIKEDVSPVPNKLPKLMFKVFNKISSHSAPKSKDMKNGINKFADFTCTLNYQYDIVTL